MKKLLPAAIAMMAFSASAAIPDVTVSPSAPDGTINLTVNDSRGLTFTTSSVSPVLQNGCLIYNPGPQRSEEQPQEVWVAVSYTYNPQTENIPGGMEYVFVMDNQGQLYYMENILDFLVDEEEDAVTRTVDCEVPLPADGGAILLHSPDYTAHVGQIWLVQEVEMPVEGEVYAFNASDATEYLGLKVLLPDSTPAALPAGHYDEAEGKFIVTDEGNADMALTFASLTWDGCELATIMNISDSTRDLDNPEGSNGWDIWTNTTSAKLEYTPALCLYLNNGKMVMCEGTINPALENHVLTNDPANYFISSPEIANSLAWTQEDDPNVFYFMAFYKDTYVGAGSPSADPFDTWLCTTWPAQEGFIGSVAYGSIQCDGLATYTPFITLGADHSYVMSRFIDLFHNSRPGNSWVAQNPLFVAGIDDIDGTFGSEPLYMPTRTAQYTNRGKLYLNLFSPTHYGLLGDKRAYDAYDTRWSVAYNGETVITFDHYNQTDFQEGVKPWCESETGPGRVTMTGVNTNQSLLGVPATTTCVNDVAWPGDDYTAPSLMAMTIRDGKGKVTCDIDDAEGALLAIASVDSEYSYVDYHTTFYAPEVKIEYAVHDVGEWKEFAVTNLDNGALQTALGLVSVASLDEIDAPEGRTMYDVRITLADAVGNTMTQTISPCFRLTGMSGIQSVGTDTDAPAEYWSIDGLRVDPATYRGIAICRRGTTITKTILR